MAEAKSVGMILDGLVTALARAAAREDHRKEIPVGSSHRIPRSPDADGPPSLAKVNQEPQAEPERPEHRR